MKPVVIFGIGEYAQVVTYYLRHDSPFEIVAYTVDADFIGEKSEFEHCPLVPFEEIDRYYPPEEFDMFIAIGYRNLNAVRTDRYLQAKKKGYHFITYICSRSTSWENLQIGENSFIMEGNTIQPFVRIGNNVIIWCQTLISHHVIIEDHCFIASNVTISGGVTVGENSFLGIHSAIREHVSIGKNSLIGAGASVFENTGDNSALLERSTPLMNAPSQRLKSLL